jgi:hypothetical protein
MTFSTAGCQLGISVNASSTTQSKTISFRANFASVIAGRVWIISPNEETFTIRTRNVPSLIFLNHQIHFTDWLSAKSHEPVMSKDL